MPERYFQMFDGDQIAGHVRLFRRFWRSHLAATVTPPDRPGV